MTKDELFLVLVIAVKQFAHIDVVSLIDGEPHTLMVMTDDGQVFFLKLAG
jgi:hypothetical protein